jgi:hypothetical protein
MKRGHIRLIYLNMNRHIKTSFSWRNSCSSLSASQVSNSYSEHTRCRSFANKRILNFARVNCRYVVDEKNVERHYTNYPTRSETRFGALMLKYVFI